MKRNSFLTSYICSYNILIVCVCVCVCACVHVCVWVYVCVCVTYEMHNPKLFCPEAVPTQMMNDKNSCSVINHVQQLFFCFKPLYRFLACLHRLGNCAATYCSYITSMCNAEIYSSPILDNATEIVYLGKAVMIMF